MTYQLIRPAGQPYAAPEYQPYFGTDHTIAPDIVGGGSWSDDSDDTYVSFLDDGTNGPSLVAVTFPPIPNLIYDDAAGGFYGIQARIELFVTSPNLGLPEFYVNRDVNNRLGLSPWLNDFAPVDAPITTPTTFTSGNFYGIKDAAAAEVIRTEGLTVTVGAAGSVLGGAQEVYRVYELGLWFDVASASPAPWLRQYPRSPLRHWPAESAFQRSNRRAGGYL